MALHVVSMPAISSRTIEPAHVLVGQLLAVQLGVQEVGGRSSRGLGAVPSIWPSR